MIVVPLKDFVQNADKYMSDEQIEPFEVQNGSAKFTVRRKLKRHGSLEKARKEADALLADPNAKSYKNFAEFLDEIGIKI